MMDGGVINNMNLNRVEQISRIYKADSIYNDDDDGYVVWSNGQDWLQLKEKRRYTSCIGWYVSGQELANQRFSSREQCFPLFTMVLTFLVDGFLL